MTKKPDPIKKAFRNLEDVLHENYIQLDEFIHLKELVTKKIQSLKDEVIRTHHQHKPSAEKSERYVNWVETDRSQVRMTYRPHTGECLLKFPRQTPQFKRELAVKLAYHVIKNLSDDIKLTLRGALHWSESMIQWRVTLQDNGRSIVTQKFTLP
jgi:hypothetical protein